MIERNGLGGAARVGAAAGGLPGGLSPKTTRTKSSSRPSSLLTNRRPRRRRRTPRRKLPARLRRPCTAGQPYSFTPQASDADDDFLEFTIENKPTWAAFSAETGALTGTPADANVGESGDITISVTDGRDTRSVGPFNINGHAAQADAAAERIRRRRFPACRPTR